MVGREESRFGAQAPGKRAVLNRDGGDAGQRGERSGCWLEPCKGAQIEMCLQGEVRAAGHVWASSADRCFQSRGSG